MEYIESKDAVVIYSKKIGMTTIINKLADLSGEQVSGFFYTRKIKLPRKFNVMALIGALNDRIKELNSLSLSRDAFEKLQYYPEYTEYQLQTLFEKIGTEEDFLKYRKYVWMLIIRNFESLQIMDGEAQYLLNVRKQKIDSFSAYFSRINSCSLDIDKEFDGCPIINLENLLKNTFSQDEIRSLGKKYDIVIPNRLKKEDLIFYVKLIMKSKKKLTKVLEKELDGMTVVQLNSFCQLQQILLSAALKKEELVYLFLFLIHQAEFKTLNLPHLIDYDFATPLEFTVDLSAVNVFGKGEPKKVIYYEEPEEERPDSIIPATVEGIDVVIDLEKGTVTPQPQQRPDLGKKQNEKDPIASEEIEEPIADVKEDDSAVPEEMEAPVEDESEEEEDFAEPEEMEEPVEDDSEEEEDFAEPEEMEEPVDDESEEEEDFAEPEEMEEPVEDVSEEEEDFAEPEEIEEPVEDDDDDFEEDDDFAEPEENEESIDDSEENLPRPDEPKDQLDETDEDDSDELDDLSDLDDDDDDIDDDRLDELVNIDDEEDELSQEADQEPTEPNENNESIESKENEEQSEPAENEKPSDSEETNESYDEDFVAEKEKESEQMQEDGIENPYYGSKKLAPKKKQLITTLIVAGVIVTVLVALALVIHFLG